MSKLCWGFKLLTIDKKTVQQRAKLQPDRAHFFIRLYF
jgi:hypothetical protein